MKRLPLLLLSLYCLCAYAQKNIPAFGEIDKSDLTMTVCKTDKDAAACKLISSGSVHYEIIGGETFTIVIETRVRIKIFRKAAKSRGNITLRYHSNNKYENIYDIAGQTYNLGNAGEIIVSRLDKAAVSYNKVDNGITEVSFSLPDVRPGSVIEYQFKDSRTSVADIDDWYFQDDIPTQISTYETAIPDVFEFSSDVIASHPVEQQTQSIFESNYYKQERISYNLVRKTFTAYDIPAAESGAFTGSSGNYPQRVRTHILFCVFRSIITDPGKVWPILITGLMNDDNFGQQLRKGLQGTDAPDIPMQHAKDEYSKMVLIYDYVRHHIQWNGLKGIYTKDGIRSAWNNRSGSNPELNLLMVRLMRNAGLHAYPLLVNTGSGQITDPLRPSLRQFTEVMTLVKTGNRNYVLNAADKYTPPSLVPPEAAGTQALLADYKTPAWVWVQNIDVPFRRSTDIRGEVTAGNRLQAKAAIHSYGYAKMQPGKKRAEDPSSPAQAYTQLHPLLQIDSFHLSGEQDDAAPLAEEFAFSLPLQTSGDLSYFTLNLFNGLDENPFTAETRTADIHFQYKRSYVLTGNISLPENYEFREVPKNIRFMMPDSGITLKRFIRSDSHHIDFRITIDFSKEIYPANDYPVLKEFYEKLFGALNEKVVIRKK